MSDFYEHALAELREELKEESYIKAELKEQLATKSAHNNGLLEKVNDLGNEANALRQTVYDLRQEALTAKRELFEANKTSGMLAKLVHTMRSCENCTEAYCQDGADHEKGEECYQDDKKHWEHML